MRLFHCSKSEDDLVHIPDFSERINNLIKQRLLNSMQNRLHKGIMNMIQQNVAIARI